MLLVPIKKLMNAIHLIRKPCEAHLIQKGKTIEPLGISKRDE